MKIRCTLFGHQYPSHVIMICIGLTAALRKEPMPAFQCGRCGKELTNDH